MHIRNLTLAATLPLSLLAACQPLTPNLDSHFGESVNIVKAQQTINPNASLNTDPVSGVDGKSARSAMENYDKSFKTPPRTSISNTTEIGGASGGN